MKFGEFLRKVQDLPVIDTEIIYTGKSDAGAEKVQISRWVKAGRLVQIRRGYYLLSREYRKIEPFAPYIASLLVAPSYVSCEKALEFHGLIPESVPVYTSVTTKRQARFVSEKTVFEYRHIMPSLFWGYNSVSYGKQTGFMALPEKALLDFFYLKKKIRATTAYIEELRLQNTDVIDTKRLYEFAGRFRMPGMDALAKRLSLHIKKEEAAVKTL